ncbi:MAG: hypothetical protein IJA97_02570 [Clostridia bacterium]|nr:hypothetical protein [Clostridia bacterium]
MKKFLALLLTVLTMLVCLTGCKDDVSPLANVGGEVKSGNGTFAVEKGDYLYFINGVATDFNSNEMGSVLKGALCRVKTSEIGVKDAGVEVVIPKLMATSSATNGVFIYGDTVYYASPYDEKDKSGTIRSDYTDFRYFNLKDAKSQRIGYEDSTVSKYQFIQNGGKVYLAYEYTEKVDEKDVKKFRVLDMAGSEVYSTSGYSSLLFADDNSSKIFFAKAAYSESLKADEAFSEVYLYNVGSADAELVYSGCGQNALERDGRKEDATYKAKIFSYDDGTYYTDFMGVTVNLIKNTGKVLVMKVSSVDTNLATAYYFGLDLTKTATVANLEEMGKSNTYIDTALASTSYFKSLNEVYYVENTTYLKGLVKFNYENLSNEYHGRTLVSGDAEGYNISSVDGNYMYLCGSAGDYYRIDLVTAGAELKKINAIKAKSVTEWFAPRVVNNKFICVYSDAIFQGYTYSVDVSKIDDATVGENGKTAYETYLEDHSELERAEVIALGNTIVGKMTEDNAKAFTTALDATYPEETTDEE